jgi:photosystem II stability/assembly factor-like uncharacterized protein
MSRPAISPGKLFFIIYLSLAVGSLYAAGQSADQVGALYEKFSWRSIGPAVMGGRTVDIEAVEKTPWIVYAAIGPSGVWKSDNSGVTWAPVFYKEATVSVGDIAIAQSHPDIVWAGTGEATCRNSVTIGDGVYKSVDAGKTWTNMGLKDTRQISRIVINRGDPNIVYVAAMGHLWGPNMERGVYKTTDGGKTWRKVLYINENTGISDLAMDPADSLILYAAGYDHRRLPYLYTSGGPGSGIYKTVDGGETWTRLTKDLPEGTMGRIGLDVSRNQPGVVYALIEHQEGGIWRSEDQGESWTRTCDTATFKRVNTRPFYYSQIRVDPTDDKVVYVLSTGLHVSTDGAKKFRPISAGIHPDHHALWIDPNNPLHLIEGNDGGIDISYDMGKNWLPVQNMDLAEVYQVGCDMRRPYYVYCGLQDNGSWGGPSATADVVGIANDDWVSIGGGDGFFVQPDPRDVNTVYGNSQMDNLYRYDWRIGLSKAIRPAGSPDEPPFRFNWNAPVHISPYDSNTVYTGGNFLFMSPDRGVTWQIISPDLTTNDPKKQQDSGGPITPDNSGAEIYCTITSIAESPVEKGLIWCGTDDGNLQLTRDGGQTWKNVVGSIPLLPRNTWCSRVEASHFEAGVAYAAFDGHRTDDYATYVYRTTDYGKTWKSIKGNLPFGWVHVIREDPMNRNLLYVGTEFGIYASLDGGASWFSMKNDLPTVAVHDIAVHPRDNDLIIGTHGRGIWILDDISFLQEMSPDVLASPVHVFSVRPVAALYLSARRESFTKPVFAAKNPPYGMAVTVFLKTKPKERPRVSFINPEDETIFELALAAREGLQREYWNLRFVPKTKDGKKITPTGIGMIALPLVAPANFKIELEVDGQKFGTSGQVEPDLRFEMTDEARTAQQEAIAELLAMTKKMGLAITSATNISRQLENLAKDLKKEEKEIAPVDEAIAVFEKKFRPLEEEIVPKEFGGVPSTWESALRGGPLNQQLLGLGSSIGGYPSAPTETDLCLLDHLGRKVDGQVERINQVIREDLPALNRILEENQLKPLKAPAEVKLTD